MANSEHTSKQFDADLEDIRSRVLQMGGLVEIQLTTAIEGLATGGEDIISRVIKQGGVVDARLRTAALTRNHTPGEPLLGAGTTPGRVYKGQKMAGHMGDERVTLKKVRVVRADTERNLLLVSGSLPGSRGALLLVKKA